MRILKFLLFICFITLFFGCFADRQSSYYKEEGYPAELDEPVSKKKMSSSAPAAARAGGAASLDVSQTPATQSLSEDVSERKRVFSGYCKISVDNVEERKKEIAHIAEENGGYVESVYEQTIVIRVPADHFHDLFQVILGLGENLYKSIETYDVTEYFRDSKVRLEIASKTRKRLYVLLEKTKDVENRLAILREIKRLTEEIERIKLSLEILERQIAFSRITVELIARLQQSQMEKGMIPFNWIAYLDPLYPSLKKLKKRIELTLSDEFAVFEKEKAYRAESAEGTRVRIGTTKNEPKGDAEFWQKALIHHLGPFYRNAEAIDLGAFKAVLFASKDAKPFFYLVGVAASKSMKDIHVIEIFFPDHSALDKNLEEIKTSVKQVQVK